MFTEPTDPFEGLFSYRNSFDIYLLVREFSFLKIVRKNQIKMEKHFVLFQ